MIEQLILTPNYYRELGLDERSEIYLDAMAFGKSRHII
jgi:hypothetical protein